ncbi:TrgA family protein [Leisingera sp. ANG-Vp]|uniref:TrgA family protein n=1 Tax=Leisingera sp. ANG-Vp TaxID=1577896 RepID=UPI000580B061|nr:TrgA family protein [Leisingera sp. ANG-Vp]KIC21239.1 tellurium resistance protein [Leisingera sp. ANG-Vp]
MPNGARLTAAITMALVAFFVSFAVMPQMPEGTDFGYFVHVNVALGLLSGWIFMGKRAGRGLVPAINNGLTGMAVMVLWALFIQGAWEMFRLAMRHRYDGPFEALSAIFVIALEYFFVIAVPTVLVPLVIGGVLSGLATENASRRWR